VGTDCKSALSGRIIKHNSTNVALYENALKVGESTQTDYMLYPSGMLVARPSADGSGGITYTKHYFAGSQRVSSKIGTTTNLGKFLEEWQQQEQSSGTYPAITTQAQMDNANTGATKVFGPKGFNFTNPPIITGGNTSLVAIPAFTHSTANEGKEIDQYYFHPDHLGSSNYITNFVGEVSQHSEYFAFGETFIEEHKNSNNSPYKFNGKELDEETGLYYYGARYYDPRISIWLSVDPLAEKYPGVSPYVYCLNNPINVIDPDGRDIIFIIDKESASKNGHIAVLIGNEKTGWKHVSMNGTGAGAKPWGKSKNPDLGTSIVDDKGRMISDPKKAIQRANVINPNENEHTYDAFKRIISTEKEDSNALTEASKSASAEKYGIAGPGKSCIDVAQSAFGSIVKDKGLDDDGDVPGESDLIPNNWFNKLDARVKEANANTSEKGKKIEFVIPKKAEKKD
jgi:RHS repeat-associated protein